MDVRGETYETWDDLKVYCRCVAGAIGRLSLGVFGTVTGRARRRARRRVRRHARPRPPTHQHPPRRPRGRRQRPHLPARRGPRQVRLLRRLPRADARRPAPTSRAWSSSRSGAPAPCSPRVTGCCRMLDRRSGACVAAMAGIYRRLLDRIAARPRGRAARPGLAARPREGVRRGARPRRARRPRTPSRRTAGGVPDATPGRDVREPGAHGAQPSAPARRHLTGDGRPCPAIRTARPQGSGAR